MLFLNKDKPLSTCTFGNCTGCDIKDKINCHFSLPQLIKFFVFAFPPFIIAGAGLFVINPLLIIPYIVLILSYFGFIEIKVMCSHCPHYAEPGISTLKCWANYGSPKLWKYKPGPMNAVEKIVFFIGLIAVIIYPVIFLFDKNNIILIIYSVLTVIGMTLLNLFLCTHCMNFACPLNKVKKQVRDNFFEKNPCIKKAWRE